MEPGLRVVAGAHPESLPSHSSIRDGYQALDLGTLTPVRYLIAIPLYLLVLTGALLSATILDSMIGTWVALVLVLGLSGARLAGVIPGIGGGGDGG